jgi:Zn-dependent protease
LFPRTGLKIARLLGIDIIINPTWLFIFALVGVSMGESYRMVFEGITLIDGNRFPQGPWSWVAGFLTAAVFFACLLAHELSHSLVARRNGIGINRITLFIFGGVAEMSKDVDSPGVEFKMAVAGPLVTFALAGSFMVLYLLAYSLDAGPVVIAPLFYLTSFNLFVGLFNILPGFPLDGGRILRAAIWKATGDLKKATRIASIGGQAVAVLVVGGGVYFMIAESPLSGIWLLVIGLFIFQLSRSAYRQTLLKLATADVSVGDIMLTGVPAVDASTSLTDLVNHYFSAYDLPVLPVTSAGAPVGVVAREDLARIDRSEWDLLNAGRVARPLSDETVVSPGTRLDEVLKTMLSRLEYLLVIEDGELRGILTRGQLTRYIDSRIKG